MITISNTLTHLNTKHVSACLAVSVRNSCAHESTLVIRPMVPDNFIDVKLKQ